MRPSPAEVARTITHGRLRGSLRIGTTAKLTNVCHASDTAGRPLTLVRDGDPLSHAFPRAGDEPGPKAELYVRDLAPVNGAPALGAVRISGRLRRLGRAEAAAAVLEFADANPITDLLDVGRQAAICRLEVEDVRLEPSAWLATDPAFQPAQRIDLTAYQGARPDPLHAIERDLLLDLSDHHTKQIESYLRCALSALGVPCHATPQAVRIDRYGFTADSGPAPDGSSDQRWTRVDFVRPVRDHHDLAHLLHPLLFHSQAG